MQYAVIVASTTGKPLEEDLFDSLQEANAYHQYQIRNTHYRRVLILLLDKSDSLSEHIIEVYFVDGLSCTPTTGTTPLVTQ